MKNIDEIVEEINLISQDYRPSESVLSVLRKKTVVGVIGPFGVGKSTLMKMMDDKDSEFSYVRGITTRPRRPAEPAGVYRFLDHTADQLLKIKEQLEEGSLVQVAVHPSTNYIYGSDLESYASPYNVLDILTTALNEFESLPFKEFKKTYIVVPVAQWSNRINARDKMQTEIDIYNRWQEAKLSLEWSLENKHQIDWVINADGKQDQAVSNLLKIGKGEEVTSPEGLEIAQSMLELVKEKLATG